ncbi:hypothetical protein F5B20DRAFT_588671 [Whalleya microplaca]|nr:hypothetical protein F5B20DRAFT_588671 [Whalleya microplaca]
MANLPSQHPHLSLHLTDRALTPLITSASPSRPDQTPHLDALTSLAHTALSAHESAQRLGLGLPQRIAVEHAGGGPVLLQSFLNPISPSSSPSSSPGKSNRDITRTPTPSQQQSNGDEAEARARSATAKLQLLHLGGPEPASTTRSLVAEDRDGDGDGDGDREEGGGGEANAPPMFVGIVVAPAADDALEARRAAARLERVGREVQARWGEVLRRGGDGDGDGEDGGGGGSGVGGE